MLRLRWREAVRTVTSGWSTGSVAVQVVARRLVGKVGQAEAVGALTGFRSREPISPFQSKYFDHTYAWGKRCPHSISDTKHIPGSSGRSGPDHPKRPKWALMALASSRWRRGRAAPHRCGGGGLGVGSGRDALEGGEVPPLPGTGCPAYAQPLSLTASASLNGICNRQ